MNFSAAQAELPSQVQQQVVEAIQYWSPAKQSILNISHTHSSFHDVAESIQKLFKSMFDLPDSHVMLIIPAGARYQFNQCAMFLRQHTQDVNYIISGHWSTMASEAARNWLNVDCFDKSECSTITSDKDSRWTFYTDNETIEGVEFKAPPGNMKLIADMTSNIFTRKVDWAAHDVVFASSQKNLGISGSCIVVVKKSLLMKDREDIFSYRQAYQQNSLHVTPCIIAWYTLYAMLEWYERNGGVPFYEAKVKNFSEKLYHKLDQHPIYSNLVDPRWRSRVSIVFDLIEGASRDHFISVSEKEGFMGLKGHKIRGGVRISLYNSVKPESVDSLVEFLDYYGKRYG